MTNFLDKGGQKTHPVVAETTIDVSQGQRTYALDWKTQCLILDYDLTLAGVAPSGSVAVYIGGAVTGLPWMVIAANEMRVRPISIPQGGAQLTFVPSAGAVGLLHITCCTEVVGAGRYRPSSGGGGGLSPTPYDATIAAYASLTHFWKMNDAAGAGAAADSKGATNLVASGSPYFGARRITNDGESSAGFTQNLADFLTFPAGLIPASPFSLEMVISPMLLFGTGSPVFFSADSAKNFDLFFDGTNGNRLTANIAGVSTVIGEMVASGAIAHIVISVGGGVTTAIVNGVAVALGAGVPSQTTAGRVGSWANATATAVNAYGGSIAKLAIYSAALTVAQARANYANV